MTASLDVRLALAGLRRLGMPRRRLPPTAPTDVDVEAVAAAGGYPAYRQLHRLLMENRISPSIEALYGSLGADPIVIDEVGRLLAAAEEDRPRVVAALYERAMRLPASERVLIGYLERAFASGLRQAAADPRGPGHAYAWSIGHALDAALTGVERTGSGRLLALAGDVLDRMLADRDDRRGRVDGIRGRALRAWGGTGLVRGTHTVNVTLAGRAAWSFARFAALARSHPGERVRAERFGEAALACLDELRPEYREGRDGSGWFTVPGGDRAEPVNHLAAIGTALLAAADLPDGAWAREQASGIARFVAGAMTEDHSGVPVWRYAVDPATGRGRGIEFVWKAQVTLQFVRRAAARATALDGAAVAAVCRTLTTNVFTPRGVNATIYRRFVPIEAYRGRRGGFQAVVALRALEPVCPAVATAVDELVAGRPEAGGWLGRPQGAIGYAGRLAS